MKRTTVSERGLVLAPAGRDAAIASTTLNEGGIAAEPCATLPALIAELDRGAGFVIVTEEALATTDLRPLADWLAEQEEWSDLPFVLLTHRGGGLERNPSARRYLEVLGNVTFLERPFHPTTLISLAESALRGRRRQYEARSRLEELRMNEARLAEGQARFQAITDSIDQMVWSTLPDGYHDYYNQRWYDYTGVPQGSTDGVGWNDMFHPDDQERAWRVWRHSLATGEPYHIEYRLRHRSGGYRWVLGRAQPVRDAEGRIVRWYGTCTDIDAQVRARDMLAHAAETLEREVAEAVSEREAALAQLHEAQKLETLGQLTGGVAHDFNNLLTPIAGALDVLSRKLPADDPRMLRLIDGAMQSAERARTLVQRLLGFARRQSLESQAVDLADLIDGMRDLIGSSVGASSELRIEAAPNLPAAFVDPNQLELAILNLCVNARDAMPNGGIVTIEIDQGVVGDASAIKLVPGTYLRLSVIDTGVGMDEVTLARAIEPFYSTKGVGRGTGLGLSMVHGLAAQLGGAFLLSSTPGKGTRADLYLPEAKTVSRLPSQRGRSVAPERRAPISILLVDDEDLVRAATADMLRELGHSVTQARGGAEALVRLDESRCFDLLITDFMMPSMDGAELARRVRERVADLPVLVITGYAGGDLELGIPQLAKPFRQTDLAARIEELVKEGSDVLALPE